MVLWEALDALSHQLELCKIDAECRIVVVVGDSVAPERSSLIRAAVTRVGADAVEVRTIADSSCASLPSILLTEIAAAADVVITTTDDLGASPGCQVLHLVDCAPHAFPPHINLSRRVHSLRSQLQSARSLVMSDRHGTNLTVDVADSRVRSDDGLLTTDQPAAQFPAGWVDVTPGSGAVNGELIVMPGDANLGARRIISSPLRLRIIDDYVAAIEGDNPDADVLRALFEHADHPSAYAVASLSLGLNPGRGAPTAFDERLLHPELSRLLAGVCTISFGENLHADRPCNQTFTLALPGRSVRLDGQSVSNDGVLDGDLAPDVYEI